MRTLILSIFFTLTFAWSAGEASAQCAAGTSPCGQTHCSPNGSVCCASAGHEEGSCPGGDTCLTNGTCQAPSQSSSSSGDPANRECPATAACAGPVACGGTSIATQDSCGEASCTCADKCSGDSDCASGCCAGGYCALACTCAGGTTVTYNCGTSHASTKAPGSCAITMAPAASGVFGLSLLGLAAALTARRQRRSPGARRP